MESRCLSNKIVEIEKKVTNITIPSKTIAQFCQRYHIQKSSFFGSVLRDDFSPESDIDILVEVDILSSRLGCTQ